MCGLGSITLASGASVTPEKLEAGVSKLLSSLDHRGGDACGILCVGNDGTVAAQNAPTKAKEFNEGRWRMTAAVRAVAVHTRMATKGKPWWTHNNHPVLGPNGAFVMHNGVVADSWLTRKAGDPEVDTFALATLVGKQAKRPARIGDHKFAERLVRAASDAEGSQTLQIAVQGQPMLVSACVRTNPLYMAESEDGSVRVTASTYAAVKETFTALGVEVPYEEHVVTRTKKGKTTTSVGKSDVIYRLNEGDVLSWTAGVHAESHVRLPAPSKKRYNASSQQSSIPYAASGGYVQQKYNTGDIVRRTRDGELLVVIGINRGGQHIGYRCEGLTEKGGTYFVTQEEYTLSLRQATKSGMTLAQDRAELVKVVARDHAAPAAGAAEAAFAEKDVAASATQDALRNPLTRQTALARQQLRRSAGTGGAAGHATSAAERFWIERCELCGVESTSVATHEDVDMCSSCYSQIMRDASLGWRSV